MYYDALKLVGRKIKEEKKGVFLQCLAMTNINEQQKPNQKAYQYKSLIHYDLQPSTYIPH